MFIAVLFIAVKYWKQLKYASSKWINKLIHPCNEILLFKKREDGEERKRERKKEKKKKEGNRNEPTIWVNFLVILLSKGN